jgi:hypothetical protein
MMTTQTQRWFWPLAIAAAVGSGCDPAPEDCPDDVPDDFECPARVGPFELVEHPGYPDMVTYGVVDASVMDGVLFVKVEFIVFRDNNEVCGYAERQDDTIRLLLQPCDLVAEGGTSSGDTWYSSLSVEIDEVDLAGATALQVLERSDRDENHPPHTPMEIAVVPLP